MEGVGAGILGPYDLGRHHGGHFLSVFFGSAVLLDVAISHAIYGPPPPLCVPYLGRLGCCVLLLGACGMELNTLASRRQLDDRVHRNHWLGASHRGDRRFDYRLVA